MTRTFSALCSLLLLAGVPGAAFGQDPDPLAPLLPIKRIFWAGEVRLTRSSESHYHRIGPGGIAHAMMTSADGEYRAHTEDKDLYAVTFTLVCLDPADCEPTVSADLRYIKSDKEYVKRTQPRACRPKGKDVITDTWTHGSSKTAVGPIRGRFSLTPAAHDGRDGWNLWLFVDAGQLPCAETRTSLAKRKPASVRRSRSTTNRQRRVPARAAVRI